LEKFAKEKLTKFKSASAVKSMDADEIMDSLALLKEQGKSKKRTCKRGACEIKDKDGKKVDAKKVKEINDLRKKKAEASKKEWEEKVKKAKASGKTLKKLECKKGKDDTGALVECSGVGICTYGKRSGKPQCACDKGFVGFACQMSEADKAEHVKAKKNAIDKMKADAKKGKIPSAKAQKDFLKSVLAENDDDVDMDPEVADDLMRSQKEYAAELVKKMRRKRQKKADSTDADFEAPTKEELNEMLKQTLQLKKQRRRAKLNAEDRAEFDKNDTNSTRKAGTLTKAERKAKRAER